MEKIYEAPKSEWINFDVADVVTDEIDLPEIGGGSGDGSLIQSTPAGGGGDLGGDEEEGLN